MIQRLTVRYYSQKDKRLEEQIKQLAGLKSYAGDYGSEEGREFEFDFKTAEQRKKALEKLLEELPAELMDALWFRLDEITELKKSDKQEGVTDG